MLQKRWGKSLQLEFLTSFFGQRICEADIHRPGLALTGFLKVFSHQRIQLVGNTEFFYLESLSPNDRSDAMHRLDSMPSPLWLFTHGHRPQPEVLECATAQHACVAWTPLPTVDVAQILTDILQEYFAPFATIHGSLVDVYGIGLLYTGKSGIGKSECVLDLVERGHRLVADDVVYLTRRGDYVIGTGNPLLGQHMEIRGVGIIDVASLFGIRSIRSSKRIEMIVDLRLWKEGENYERTGLNSYSCNLMGVDVPVTTIPVSPGKNITVISEVVAMNTLLKQHGKDSAKDFNERLIALMNNRREDQQQRIARWE